MGKAGMNNRAAVAALSGRVEALKARAPFMVKKSPLGQECLATVGALLLVMESMAKQLDELQGVCDGSQG
jgi:hypothetical protein